MALVLLVVSENRVSSGSCDLCNVHVVFLTRIDGRRDCEMNSELQELSTVSAAFYTLDDTRKGTKGK